MEKRVKYWQQMVELKKQCDKQGHLHSAIEFSAEKIRFTTRPQIHKTNEFDVLISCHPLAKCEWPESVIFSDKLFLYLNPVLTQKDIAELKLYLPLATVRMHHANKPFVIVHMAQSIDGKVCTNSGASKWIGNDENLIHAHKVRALVDGVVVGGITARQEKPSLNVRHVEGLDPARIILCNSSDGLEDLPQIAGMQNYLLCNENSAPDLDPAILQKADLTPITYHCDSNNINLDHILERLLRENIQSILLEGGPTTIKTFMQNKALNWLQLHIAPMVFGSGKSFVTLPEIGCVDDAKNLSNVFYTQMGDAIVVTGQI